MLKGKTEMGEIRINGDTNRVQENSGALEPPYVNRSTFDQSDLALDDIRQKARRRSAIGTYVRRQMELEVNISRPTQYTLTDEIGEYLMSVGINYGFADLRALVRGGKIKLGDDSLERALKLPVGWRHLIRLFFGNEKLLEEAKLETDMYRTVFECFDPDAVRDVCMSTRESMLSTDESLLLVFDDENHSTELVYGIGINR